MSAATSLPLAGATFERFHGFTAGLSGPERLALFLKLPDSAQDAMYARQRANLERERER